MTVLAATRPDRPAMVQTSNVGTSVRISWVAPYNGASSILYFNLQIKTKVGTYIEEQTYCNVRYDETVINNRFCVLPMDTLTAAPFNLVQGDLVVARILAANIVGESQYSMENGLGAQIIIAPHSPILAPYRGGQTSVDSAHVLIAPLTGAQTGGSEITSYYIQFDDLTNGVDWLELQGFTTYTTSLSFLKTGLQTNKVYQFRYKARSIFGWSDWSPVGLIKTIRIPDQMAPVVTSIQGDNVLIEWI